MAQGYGGSRFRNGLLSHDVPVGAAFVRIHHRDQGPIFFGPKEGLPPQHRFDAPGGEYRILYCAEALEGAFIETVLRKPGRIVRRDFVEERAWSTLEVLRPLRLAKLYDEGLHWHGLEAGDIAMDDYAPCRRLALDLVQDPSLLDGLAYRSRFNNGQICFALFDRVAPWDLRSRPPELFEEHAARIDQMMALYGAVFDTSPLP